MERQVKKPAPTQLKNWAVEKTNESKEDFALPAPLKGSKGERSVHLWLQPQFRQFLHLPLRCKAF